MKEYCRCGPHPLQVTSSRARPPLVKGAGHIGPLFPEFRGWPLWFMASIALWGPHYLSPEVVPGASLHSEALSPECGRGCQETGDCGPARHVGAGWWGLLGPTAHGLLGRRHPGPRLSHMVGWGWGLKYPDSHIFGWGGLACAEFPRGVEFRGPLAPFFLHILKEKKRKFLDATNILQWLDHGEVNSLFCITTGINCLFAVAIAYTSKCVRK